MVGVNSEEERRAQKRRREEEASCADEERRAREESRRGEEEARRVEEGGGGQGEESGCRGEDERREMDLVERRRRGDADKWARRPRCPRVRSKFWVGWRLRPLTLTHGPDIFFSN